VKLKVGLAVKTDAKALAKADELCNWLNKKGIEVSYARQNEEQPLAAGELFAIFALGGDGTFLRAVRWAKYSGIPILGIKFGRLGFLAETNEADLFAAVEAVVENRFKIEQRAALSVEIIRNTEVIASRMVLNDAVINKGALARLSNIHTWIDDSFLTIYRGDGLIIATPTGSTAYSLAAGGPVIHPEAPVIIITPICPFTLTNRPLIIPDKSAIKIRLEKGVSDIMLTFDGQEGFKLLDADIVSISKSKTFVNMITLPGLNYYDVLKTKLNWSGGEI